MSKSWFKGKGGRTGGNVSNAEDDLFKELQRRGLNRRMTTQIGYEFNVDEDDVYGTTVDFDFPLDNLVVFLDAVQTRNGKSIIHGKARQGRKDDLIDLAFEKRKTRVLRLEYEVPISNKRIVEMGDEIQAKLHK